jgi:hypothetical protein
MRIDRQAFLALALGTGLVPAVGGCGTTQASKTEEVPPVEEFETEGWERGPVCDEVAEDGSCEEYIVQDNESPDCAVWGADGTCEVFRSEAPADE